MGCCHSMPSKEELLINFWNNLPIRKTKLSDYRDIIIRTYMNNSLLKIDSMLAFKKFFLNENYLIYNDSDLRPICQTLFEDLAIQYTPIRFIFYLAFLCDFDKDNAVCAEALYDISKFFGLEAVRYDDHEKAIVIENFRLTQILKSILSMVFYKSIIYVYTLVDDQEYKDYMLERYNEIFLEDWISVLMGKFPNVIILEKFFKNNVRSVCNFYALALEFEKTLPRKQELIE
jgi:hypothetical protein